MLDPRQSRAVGQMLESRQRRALCKMREARAQKRVREPTQRDEKGSKALGAETGSGQTVLLLQKNKTETTKIK
eukprot:3443973-Rhodomonas_salina.1